MCIRDRRFTFHLPLDEGTTTSGCQSSKRSLCRTRQEIPEKQVDQFRRLQLGITPWACWRKELGHTTPAWASMHARARLCIFCQLHMLQIAHVIRLRRGQTRIQEVGIPVRPGKHLPNSRTSLICPDVSACRDRTVNCSMREIVSQ